MRTPHIRLISAAAVAAAIGAGGFLAAPAFAAGTPTNTTTHTVTARQADRACNTGLRVLRREDDALPKAMRTDLAAARKDPTGSARKAALEKVLQKAEAGDYGADVKTVATAHHKSVAAFRRAWDQYPAQLRTDLKAARTAHGTARQADIRAIDEKALSGGYGKRIEAAAQKEKTRLDRCEAGPTNTTTPAPAPGATPGADS